MTLIEITIPIRRHYENGVEVVLSKQFVTVLEDGLSNPNSGTEPDKIVMDQDKKIFLLRDSNLYDMYLSMEDIKNSYESTIDGRLWRSENLRLSLEKYYKMILDKMISYVRDSKIDSIFESDEQYI